MGYNAGVANLNESNKRPVSNTYAWRKVKVRSPAAGQKDGAPKAPRWFHLGPWDRRKHLTITVRHRGGAESWYEVKARGSLGRFPGHVCLDDVMSEIYRRG